MVERSSVKKCRREERDGHDDEQNVFHAAEYSIGRAIVVPPARHHRALAKWLVSKSEARRSPAVSRDGFAFRKRDGRLSCISQESGRRRSRACPVIHRHAS